MKIKGIHEYCTKCNKVVTSTKSKCGKKSVLARNCPFKEKHKLQSRIWNPLTKKTDRIKTWDTKDQKVLIQLHLEFKAQVKEDLSNQANDQVKPKVKPMPQLLGHCMTLYMEWIEDIDVPEHELKNLSVPYINRLRRFLKRFAAVAKPETPVTMIDNSHVGAFHKSLAELAPKTYNHHMQAVRSFFGWLVKYGYDISNPFEAVKVKTVVSDPKMIEIPDLIKMMEFITPENGVTIVNQKSKNGERQYKKNLYKPWLKHAIGLFLLTGERRDGVFLLRWEDVKGDSISIPNYKVNRKEKVDTHSREILMIPELAELLDAIGRQAEGYIIAPDRENRERVKEECSTSFSHFWKESGHPDQMQLKNLRKTYSTTMRMELGDLTRALKIHSDEVQFKNYFDTKKLREQMKGKRIFDIDFKNEE